MSCSGRSRTIALAALAAVILLIPARSAEAQTTDFVTGFNHSVPVRNNYTGFVGMRFTVGAAPLYITQLGRISGPGGIALSHTVKLVNAQTAADVPGGSVTVGPSTASPDSFAYSVLPSSLQLSANTTYLLVSQETAGGDSWYDYTTVATTGVAAVNAAVYQDAAGIYVPVSAGGSSSYVPLKFGYSLSVPAPTITITSPLAGSAYTGSTVTYSANVVPALGLTVTGVQFRISSGGPFTNVGPPLTQAPYTTQQNISSLATGLNTLQVVATDSAGATSMASVAFYVQTAGAGAALISGFSGTTVRNNYSGFVGLELTVGTSPLVVTSLGRIGLPGNSQTHTVKLVNAQTSQDVAGGSAPLTMNPFNATTFQYAALPAPVTLAPNTTYLLLSSEISGGDTWYDYSPVTDAAAGTSIAGAVYSDSAGHYIVLPNTANYSYVPVNLTASSGGGTTPGSLTITSPTDGSLFRLGTITFSATFSPAVLNTGATVQYLLNGQNYGSPVTTPPFNLQVDSGSLSETSDTLTAIGTDAAGATFTAAPIAFKVTGDLVSFIQGSSSLPPTYLGAPANGLYYGMEFTVGPTPITVQGLSGGNYNTLVTFRHVSIPFFAKLVDAATGLDIPGGTISRTDVGPLLGSFSASLPAPVTLQANKSYYLVAFPVIGSVDTAYQYLTSGVAVINHPVYETTTGSYVVANAPGSYPYVGFSYDTPTPLDPLGVTINAPSQNSALTGLVPVSVSLVYDQYLPVTSVQLQIDGKNVQAPLLNPAASPAYISLDTTALVNGAHTLTAVVTDSVNTQAASPALNVTVDNAGSPASNSPAFVTSFSPTFLRNNYAGFLGMRFTVGSVPIQISSLGRVCVAGNSASHAVKLVQVSNGADLPGAAVSVALSGCTSGQFIYAALTSPVTLPAGSSYFLVDQETVGGDKWYDFSPLATASAAIVNGPVYYDGSRFVTASIAGSSYVPLNFLFTSAPAVANPGFSVTLIDSGTLATVTSGLPVTGVQFFVDGYPFDAPVTVAPYAFPTVPAISVGYHSIVATATDSVGNTATSPAFYRQFYGGLASMLVDVINFNGTTLRNNYTGWVGFRLTTGSSLLIPNRAGPAPYFSIGRLCSSGNSMVHLVKLVNASTGLDVPGAVGWINMSGCAAGSLLDAEILGVTLAPNTSYYLVSQEFKGGDQWFDISPALPLASVSAPLPPISAELGFAIDPTGANFTIDGPVYTAANGSFIFVPSPNQSYVGLAVEGVSPLYCPGIDDCPPE